MRYCLGLALLATTHQAIAGVGYTEEEYQEMADIVVEATVGQSDCLSFAEYEDTLETDYQATLTVTNILKGEGLPAELTLVSRVTEYFGDQPSCGGNGRIHPQGEVARFHLRPTDAEGVYEDIDQFSTFETGESAPLDAPLCETGGKPLVDPPTGCSVAQVAPTLLLWLPLLVVPWRRQRRL